MTLTTLLLVAAGAAIGAPLRFALAHRLDDRVASWPVGTFAANTSGSLLLGIWWACAPGAAAWSLLAVGFCGGLTTWSSLAVQSVDRRDPVYLIATIVVSMGCFAAGAGLGGVLLG